MTFGVFVPQGWRMDLTQIADPIEQFEAMTAVAKKADEGPWDSIWVYDHFHTVPEPTPNTTFECWTITSTLARDTKRVHVGQMVGCNGYRHPALYAKIASTVDVASHGRLYAGLGAGWYEHEWKAYGYEWPELKDRMGAFAEAVQVVHKMWTEDQPVFDGKYYSIDQPFNEPKGVRKPHPSFWIGGGGPKVTLKLVAKYGDAANIGGGDPERFREKADILRSHCENVGRNFDDIIRSTSINAYPIANGADPEKATERARGQMTPDEFAKFGEPKTVDEISRQIEALQAEGANYFILYIPGLAYDHSAMELFAEKVIPRFS